MSNFFIIRNKEKNMYYWGDGSWTKSKDCARKHQHKDCAETLIYKDNLDRKNCEVVEIPSIADLEAKLAESENRVIELLDGARKLEEVKDSKIKDVRACWMKRYSQLKQQLIDECKEHREFCKVADEKVKELKQQLAEKDAEVQSWKDGTIVVKLGKLEEQLAEKENKIASLEVCLLENKNNMKEMQEFKIGEDEYDLTDEDARNDLRDYIQEFEKVSKRVYEQKEYAEKILRMSTSEEHQEILQLKQQLAEKDEKIATLIEAVDLRDKEIEALAIVLNRECVACKPTQTAIEELKITREKVCKVVWAINNMKYLAMVKEIVDVIDQQISRLKGEK